MDPREIFPPEIWEKVFDKVEDPQDWFNLYRASPYFQGVVGMKRTTRLHTQVFPHLLEYLRGNDIFTLRLVSRPWKEAVDDIVENFDAANSTIPGLYIRLIWSRMRKKSYHFHGPAGISSFLEHFESHSSGNPFVGNFASFQFSLGRHSPEELREFCVWVPRLLEKFGAHLKTLHIRIIDVTFDSCRSLLQICLNGGVPNLESLTVACSNNSNDGGCDAHDDCGGDEDERGELIPYTEEGPRPLLPNLKHISLNEIREEEGNGLLLGLRNAVAQMCCSPSSLRSVETVGFPPALLACPNVDSAELTLRADDAASVANLLPIPPWPLSRLAVSYNDTHLGSLFTCVEHFKGTLTSLHLHFQDSSGLYTPPNWKKLDLPNLKELTMTIEATPTGVSLLEHFTELTNLESLSIRDTGDIEENATGSQNVVAAGVQSEVVRLGLWEALAKLTKISLIGTRITNRLGVFSVRHVSTRASKEFRRQRQEDKYIFDFNF